MPKQHGQVLGLERLLEMVETVPDDYWMYRSALLLLIYTGLRPAELCGLRVGRLDILKGFVHICETLTDVGGRLIVGPTKTDQDRILPLPEFLCDVLAEHLAWRADFRHASQIIDMGASPLVVKERRGHGDVLTTMRKYGHLFEGVQQRLATDLNSAHKRAETARGRTGEVLEIGRRSKTQS